MGLSFLALTFQPLLLRGVAGAVFCERCQLEASRAAAGASLYRGVGMHGHTGEGESDGGQKALQVFHGVHRVFEKGGWSLEWRPFNAPQVSRMCRKQPGLNPQVSKDGLDTSGYMRWVFAYRCIQARLDTLRYKACGQAQNGPLEWPQTLYYRG